MSEVIANIAEVVADPVKEKKVDTARDPLTIPTQIRWVNIYANNNFTTAEFYERLLGWKGQSSEHAKYWMEVKGPRDNFTAIGLHSLEHAANKEVKAGQIGLHMTVKNLQGFHELVKDIEGLKIQMAPSKQFWGGYMACYITPDGVEFALLEELPEIDPDVLSVKTEAKAETEDAVVESKSEKPESHRGDGICYVEIPCRDIERAAKFFGDTFNWTCNETLFKTNDADNKLSGGFIVSEERVKHPMIYINVKDIDTTLRKVEANGGAVLKGKYSIHPERPEKCGAKFTDSEGNMWLLYSDDTQRKHTL